jgi:3-oxoacyl-[acyl-carrier protein] reductase
MDIDLRGEVAVVTGASRGIGAAIAEGLGSCGAHVVVNYRGSRDLAEGVARSIAEAGGSAEALGFDITDEDQVKQAFQDVASRLGRIDILVNNAGVSRDSLLLRLKTADVDEMLGTNLKGTFFCSFHASRYMLKQKKEGL